MSSKVYATVFGDDTIDTNISSIGINTAKDIEIGNNSTSVSDFIINIVQAFLKYVGIAAVVVLVIAGIMLIISGGNDDLKGKAQKIITYTVIGLIVIVLASAIVSFISSLL